jgi:hypothetical protein
VAQPPSVVSELQSEVRKQTLAQEARTKETCSAWESLSVFAPLVIDVLRDLVFKGLNGKIIG